MAPKWCAWTEYKYLFDKVVNASVPNHDGSDEMCIYDVNVKDKWKDLVLYPITWLQEKGLSNKLVHIE